MSALDLEAEYNNRARVPDHAAIQARWAEASKALRAQMPKGLDRPYGTKLRQRYDLFEPAGTTSATPLVVYIHGGYWQRGDRQDNAFVARELVAKGVSVAVVGYTLAPEASVMDIVGELRQCLKALWEATKRYPVVVGHSAGGQLTAALLATDWGKVGGVPTDLVRAGYAISGVFDVAPLIPTSLNGALKLDAATAKTASPINWPAPASDRTLVAAVGGDESGEFIRQSLAIASAWSAAGVKAECVIVPGTNHFTIVEELMRAESAMVARIAGLARQCAQGTGS